MIGAVVLLGALLAAIPADVPPSAAPSAILAPVPMPENPAERRGRLIGLQCSGCHTVKPGNGARIGPSLIGIIGAKAGAQPGFYYSQAMRDSGLVWDRGTLDSFLAGPAKLVPGTRMQGGAVLSPQDRQAVIAWLESLGK